MHAASVTLRPETAEDIPFLRDLFLSTKDENEGWRDLDPSQRTSLLESQFEFQYKQYHSAYPGAWHTIITVDGKPAGRLYVWKTHEQLRIIDISLLPEYRQHGIGSKLIGQIKMEAAQSKLPLRLMVHNTSSARDLYKRLGLPEVSRDDVYALMEWNPEELP